MVMEARGNKVRSASGLAIDPDDRSLGRTAQVQRVGPSLGDVFEEQLARVSEKNGC